MNKSTRGIKDSSNGFDWLSILLLIIILSYLIAIIFNCFYKPKTFVIKDGKIKEYNFQKFH